MRYDQALRDARGRECSAGMTLVEILVVITIISILAALVFVGISSVKTSAHRAACSVNMRALWAGCLIYSNDHQGWLPGTLLAVGPQKIDGVATNYQFSWLAKTLEGYISDDVINDPDPVSINFSHNPATPTKFGRIWKLYISAGNPDNGVSPLLIDTKLPWPWSYSVKMNALSMPAKTAVLNCQDDTNQEPLIVYPHNGKINRLFADGHVSVVKMY